MALKRGMILYCKNGEIAKLRDFNDEEIKVMYHGKDYIRPRSAIGRTLFAHQSMIDDTLSWGIGRNRNNPQWEEIYGGRSCDYDNECTYSDSTINDDEQSYEDNIADFIEYQDYDDPPVKDYGRLCFDNDDYFNNVEG